MTIRELSCLTPPRASMRIAVLVGADLRAALEARPRYRHSDGRGRTIRDERQETAQQGPEGLLDELHP